MKKIVLLFITFVLMSCSSSESARLAICNNTNTEFHVLFDQLVVANHERNAIDTQRHDITFEVLHPKRICSIGYQSQPQTEGLEYRIEIFDNTSSTLLYSGNHLFSSSAPSYVSVGSIALEVGHSYTVKRIFTNFGSDIMNCIGRIVQISPGSFTYPIINGDLKITDAFYSNSFENTIPFIDVVFEQ